MSLSLVRVPWLKVREIHEFRLNCIVCAASLIAFSGGQFDQFDIATYPEGRVLAASRIHALFRNCCPFV